MTEQRDPIGAVALYALSEASPGSGERRSACNPDSDGPRLGFPHAAAFAPDGRHEPHLMRILITCTSGANAKCVRFGYVPWRTTPESVGLTPYYQACVRLVRADDGGDGIGPTWNGTAVGLFDRIGVQREADRAIRA